MLLRDRFTRFLLLLCSGLLFAATLSEAIADDKLTKFHKQSASSRGPKGLIQLNDDSYAELTSAPRSYSVIVLLTALDPHFRCQVCKDLQPEYELVAKSWYGEHPDANGLFFTMLDFTKGKGTFQKLGLTTAPIIYLFPPTTGPNAKPDNPIKYELTTGGISADALAGWVSRSTSLDVKVIRPFNWQAAGTTAMIVLGAITTLRIAWPVISPILMSRNLWAAVSLISVLLFTSGHMFNHIRKVPYVVQDGRGGINYIVGGFSNQLGLESQIIALLYGTLSFAVISLALKTPTISDPKRQQLAVLVWNVVLLFLFSFLMNLFKVKNGAYPFWLPPLVG